MLRLIFTICMIDAPSTCEQREMLVYDDMPAVACVMGAMPELASWQQTHPNWRIARWRCEGARAQRSTSADDMPGRAVRVAPVAGWKATAPGDLPIAMSP